MDIVHAPSSPVRLGDQTGQFGGDVRQRGQTVKVPAPAVEAAPSYIRLAQVIQHQPRLRQCCREFDRLGQLPRIYQDVVGQPVSGEAGDAAAERGVTQETVGFALDDVADADEPAIGGQPAELRIEIRGPQIDPADNPLDERIFRRQLQKPAGFLERLPDLNGDTSDDARRPHSCRRVLWHEVAAERREAVIDPRVLDRVVAPEMDVGVEGAGRLDAQGARLKAYTESIGIAPRSLDT